ncbi:MAG TPA: hypothetical protein VII44_10790 [Puia sp.]
MTTKQQNLVSVGKSVNSKHEDTLIREYKQSRWASNSERIGKPDSLSAWYSIEDMENFLAAAKSKGGDGIKFYFGAHPKDYVQKPEYADRQTLVMVATKSKLTETGAIANKDIYYSNNGKLKILSGTGPILCPPICNPPSEGGMGDLGITIIDKGEKGMEIA